MTLERAKELLKAVIEFLYERSVGGEPPTDDDVINLLFLIGFTEEELMEEFGYTEDAIDAANATQEG